MDIKYNKINLLQSENKEYFLDCVDELYSTIERDSAVTARRITVKHTGLKSLMVWMLSKVYFLLAFRIRIRRDGVVNFASMIGGDLGLFIPWAYQSCNNCIFMYDAWPRFHKWLFPMLDFFNISHVFFSSKQVAVAHREQYPDSRCKSMWLPEALNCRDYHFNKYEEKTIDLLEFGRIYTRHHELIRPVLEKAGKYHLYRKPGEDLLFPDKASFATGLAAAKIVICVPSSITHPERAEYISTMTLRYLQAMASKCLILGIMPSDMQELFDYLPIVEIDMENAGTQVTGILDNYSSYIPLIERNYLEVSQKHQWANRWEVIRKKISEMQ